MMKVTAHVWQCATPTNIDTWDDYDGGMSVQSFILQFLMQTLPFIPPSSFKNVSDANKHHQHITKRNVPIAPVKGPAFEVSERIVCSAMSYYMGTNGFALKAAPYDHLKRYIFK